MNPTGGVAALPASVYALDPPERPRSIVLFGAGGIVHDAHLPAYRKAGLPVSVIYNRNRDRAEKLATDFGIPVVVDSVADAVAAAPVDAVFDLALMPEQYVDVLSQLPDRAAVLIQKPLGNDLSAAHSVAQVCREKQLIAAVNAQLRFAPYIQAARIALARGRIGELADLEIRVAVNTPWQLFPNVADLPRLEINAHSVHYLDLVRSFVGEPASVSAVTVPRPGARQNTRTEMILHYPERPLRVVISANHDHRFGSRYEQSYAKWEGTAGAIRAQLGLLLNYPTGGEDRCEQQLDSDASRTWTAIPFSGSWFPDAFIGTMSSLQRYVEGSSPYLPTSIADGMATMALVETAYASAARGGVPVLAEPAGPGGAAVPPAG